MNESQFSSLSSSGSQMTDELQRSGSFAGEIARGVSEPMERGLAREPVNSSVRTALLVAAGASILGSLIMQMQGRKHEALFVGQWAPTLVSFALWYQIVKSQ